MRKASCNVKCKCGSNNVVKNGFDSKNRQRYKCNECKRIFTRNQKCPRTRSMVRAVGILYNLISNELYNETSIIRAITKASKDNIPAQIKDVLIDRCVVSSSSSNTIFFPTVNKPKIIIGTDDNGKLRFYKVPEQKSNQKCKIYIEDK